MTDSRGKSGNTGDYVLSPLWSLRGYPSFGAIGTDVNGAIHGFHGGVGRKGELVNDVDLFRCGRNGGIGVAVVAYDLSGFRSVGEKLLAKAVGGFRGVRALVPGNLQGFAALHGGPGAIGDDHDSAGSEGGSAHRVDGENVDHAGNSFGFGGVEGFQFSAKDGAAFDYRILHAGNTGIDAKFRGAIDLLNSFIPASVVANDSEIGGILERNGFEIGDGEF